MVIERFDRRQGSGRPLSAETGKFCVQPICRSTRKSRRISLWCADRFLIFSQALNVLQLFNFIQADLNNHRALDGDADSPFNNTSGPAFPKSLYLINPLTNSYDLNPVASTAQANVAIPAGLDLDEWFVPPPAPASTSVIDQKVKKSKKAKGKEAVNGKNKSKRKPVEDYDYNESDGLSTPAEVIPETSAEKAERERVSPLLINFLSLADLSCHKLKAERLERLRDDPYYIMDRSTSTKPPGQDEDVDSIPVVHLDGMPSLSGQLHLYAADKADFPFLDVTSSASGLPKLRPADLNASQSSYFTIDRDGEMPEGSSLRTSTTPSAVPSPLRVSSAVFSGSEPSTPEPIKVTKVKKKGASKKRPQA